MDFENFKNKKIWAVVGSVSNNQKYAYKIYHFLKSKGYQTFGVDPSGEMIDGEKTYKTLSELPIKPEVIDMVINPIKGGSFVKEANKLGIDHIWFQPGAESEELIKLSREFSMKLIFNDCVMIRL